jgi:hypothetical protein
MPRLRRLAAALLVVVAREAAALAGADAAPDPPPERAAPGPFLGPGYRYGEMWVPRRVLYDVVAIPANVGGWDAGDWAQLGVLGGAVGALWLWPSDPSPDVRIDRWTKIHVNPHVPEIWGRPMQAALWSSIAVGGLATWWWSAERGHEHVAEGISLMAEALAVGQVYHVGLKFLIGREGPGDGSDEGRTLGPFRALRYYPAGTPSGHSATLFSLLSAGFAHFDAPAWLQVAGVAGVGGLVAFHVVDHKHYLSDTLWGAAMGWYVGQWVVRHRASGSGRVRPLAARAEVVPVALRGGLGVGLAGRF